MSSVGQFQARASEASTGYELRCTDDQKDEGIFATRPFKRQELVIKGNILESDIKNNSHASQVGVNKFVLNDELLTKINHSCDPNCGIRINKDGAREYVAFRDIEAGEELTFDYAMGNYTVDHFPSKCCCGSIKGWINLPDERKLAYKDFVSPYLLEM